MAEQWRLRAPSPLAQVPQLTAPAPLMRAPWPSACWIAGLLLGLIVVWARGQRLTKYVLIFLLPALAGGALLWPVLHTRASLSRIHRHQPTPGSRTRRHPPPPQRLPRFDQRTESAIYDTLARSVHGELLRSLYPRHHPGPKPSMAAKAPASPSTNSTPPSKPSNRPQLQTPTAPSPPTANGPPSHRRPLGPHPHKSQSLHRPNHPLPHRQRVEDHQARRDRSAAAVRMPTAPGRGREISRWWRWRSRREPPDNDHPACLHRWRSGRSARSSRYRASPPPTIRPSSMVYLPLLHSDGFRHLQWDLATKSFHRRTR